MIKLNQQRLKDLIGPCSGTSVMGCRAVQPLLEGREQNQTGKTNHPNPLIPVTTRSSLRAVWLKGSFVQLFKSNTPWDCRTCRPVEVVWVVWGVNVGIYGSPMECLGIGCS